jgi:threonylcarbamoyladenosine tRNA methylthiotransferase MtaB
MKKVAFYTLGCKLNFSETSTISRSFQERGYLRVDFSDTPDIFIINTCSVTENADKKCRKIVREARKISPDGYVAIIGCYAQLKPREIAEIEGVDAVLGAAEKFRLHELLDDFVREPQTKVLASEVAAANTFVSSYSANDRTRSFLKVQDGCDYSCTFCTIPLARGSSRSSTMEDVIEKANQVADSGVKEIVLTGVNTGDFGIRNGKREDRFIDLVRALEKRAHVGRIRISSIEPNLLTDEIIEFVADSNKFVPHFHIPLQSGSDKVLRQMKRRYLTPLYTSRIAKIREYMPDACIGVDVIVGFPGESEADFMETYRYLNELDISYLHVFTYSERPNTPAIDYDDSVEMKERHRRSMMLRILSEKKRRAFYEKEIGKTRTVLFEEDIEDGLMFGYTENYIRIGARYDPLRVNEKIEVVLSNIHALGYVEVEEPVHAYH